MASALIASILLSSAMIAACSSNNDTGQSSPTAPHRPSGPKADLSHELTGGTGVFLGDPTTVNLKQHGYVQHEYVAAGTATSYQAKGPLTGDGRWSFTPVASAPYRTRV
ncbi:MAG TPA: alpha/beta hydrolase domain-containing protein, partial [Acidimicrobiales bacterium]|nr:alpha/beta hydrolase domain-containing protein [Acidimicrobiales bacterium]